MSKTGNVKKKWIVKAEKLFQKGMGIKWFCCNLYKRPCSLCYSTLDGLHKRIDIMNEVLTLNPRHVGALYQKANMLISLTTRQIDSPFIQLIEEALKCAIEAADIGFKKESDNINLLLLTVDIYYLLEQYELVLDFLLDILSIKYVPRERMIVMALCALGKYEEALELFKKQAELRFPAAYNREEYYGIESIILTGFGEFDQFIKNFEQKKSQELKEFGRLKYFMISDYYHMGKIFEKYGNKQMALEHYNGALRINSSYPPAIKARDMLLNQTLQ